MLKRFLCAYLDFSGKSRNAIIFLLALILIFTALPWVFPLFIPEKSFDHNEFQQQIASFNTGNSAPVSGEKKQYPNVYEHPYRKEFDTDDREYQTGSKAVLFYFDPNTLDASGWQQLGVREKTIHTIQNYLEKGGRFYQPADIHKIWGISPELANRLQPYIQIAGKKSTPTQNEQPDIPNEHEKKWQHPVTIDINVADTAALIALPGIGSKLAQRIIMFREKLGGFYSIAQIGETFGLADSVFQKIKQRLVLQNAAVKKINLNTAAIDDLKSHPYIRYAIGNAIVQYRLQHGLFTNVAELKKLVLITDELYNRLQPYLTVE